ncbi:MAG TPA: serine acetyltransferase [Bacteroidales bacterium]|jgi:serine O-acetyltransferase|nr:serine acetyltransferase [Bacteroidales bacterium]HPB35518.1 serine acetyltransferase [Bacteroidales bacterium]HPN46785.1 serine acetyltransferase [Bacteroidales bacterium]HQN87177.1 serine acetyltransferase [Bacteroidales bacterium]
MNTNQSKRLKETICQLSQYESFKELRHERAYSDTLPSTLKLEEIIRICRGILFPGYFGNASVNKQNLAYHMGLNTEKLLVLLSEQIAAGLSFFPRDKYQNATELKEKADTVAEEFIFNLPELRKILYTDIMATYNGDPAAESIDEVIYCYPGIRAISSYRIAHLLLKLDVPIIPRIITEMAHSETGIDIHPAASIGHSFSIDHGTGVVIGATAILGNHVKLYQGVTLGAKSFSLDDKGNPVKGVPRHPILEDNVIVYSNATILGRITIGENAVVGGNIWVTEDVPPGARVVQSKRISE